MTLQELINNLNNIEDKNLDVMFPYDYGVDESNNPLSINKITEYQDCVVLS